MSLLVQLWKPWILQHGSRVILIEAPYSAVKKVNEYVVRGAPVPASAMSDLYFIWRSKENFEFFNRLSLLNRELTHPVQIIGIDIRQPVGELASVLNFWAVKNPSEGRLANFPVQNAKVDVFRTFESGVQQGSIRITTHERERAETELEAISTAVKEDQELSVDERWKLVFFIRKLIHWMKNYEAMSNQGSILGDLPVRNLGIFESVTYHMRTY